jgi:hypothetical protein
MMYLLCQLDGDLPGYPREQFEEDIVNECEKDIRSTEGWLAPRNDPRNPWTTRNLLPFFIELDNRVLDRFSAEERARISASTSAPAVTLTPFTAPTCRTRNY